MDIVLLDYLLRIFAIIANLYPHLLLDNVKNFIKSSFLKELSIEIESESLRLFTEYYKEYAELRKIPETQINLQILLQTIQLIDKDIPRKQKFLILIRLMLFENTLLRESQISGMNPVEFSDILNLVLENFQISTLEYLNCRGFIGNKLYKVPDKKKVLIVEDTKRVETDLLYLYRDQFPGQLLFLYIESTNTILLNYKGKETLMLNNQVLFSNHIYFFHKGSSVKGSSIEPVYYNQVLRRFVIEQNVNIEVQVENVEFHFKNSSNGIHELSLTLESEQLIGIIGRSGVGKSTLINLMIGNIRPQKGRITINGLDLEKDNEKLDGLVGYVPQDDLLIEELSVFRNLSLNASLCFDNLSPDERTEKVKNLLTDLDLYEVRNLRVGSPLNKFISGGQRKKLNIALELLREPWILYADEPTSGLSSSDSEEIMQLLSEQTSKGRLVIVNIHQPSSDIFKLFDKIIVLDKEGYPVYFGNPLDAIPYFNEFNQRVSTIADFCNVCENINPESIFKIIEEKKTNDFGEYIKERRILPDEWHRYFLKKTKTKKQRPNGSKELPKIQFNKPGVLSQFFIFGKRNVLSKLTNRQYVFLALLISPLLALLLGTLCRYNNPGVYTPGKYIFAQNDNIPSFLFMSVIVALFVGLIISAEEIIRDRKILMRESFLKLSRMSYMNSKVVFVFALSLIQTLMYVGIGNWILGIQGMTLSFWLILFSTSCFANLMGLLISSVFTSVIAIYIMVPLIIVPQILLSGVVVNYDKLNNVVASKQYVPFVGDLMASRWAYEALIVTQFAHNSFQKNYFHIEKKESNDKFKLLFVIPEMKKSIANLEALNHNQLLKDQNDLRFLYHEVGKFKKSEYAGYFSQVRRNKLNLGKIKEALDRLNTVLPANLNRYSQQKDSITRTLVTQFGGTDQYLDFKNRFYNSSLADLVLKRKELASYKREGDVIIRKMEPIYQISSSNYGRAQFLASSKRIFGLTVDTMWFNLMALWFMSIILYVILIIFSNFRTKPK